MCSGFSIFGSPALSLQPGLLTVTVLILGLDEVIQKECQAQYPAPSAELLPLTLVPFSMAPEYH